jgi:CheY-like chemotaxis protein
MNEKPTILVVDDEPDIVLMLEYLLSEKYNVVIANDGQDAFEKVKANPNSIDLVITDIQMPNMDGMTLLSKIQEAYPHIGVIMISAHGNIQTAVEAMKKGAYDYITKPLPEFDEVDLTIARYFEKRRLESKLAEYVKLRDELMASRVKVYSFLSVDVIDSVGMKQGVDLLLVQYSFMEYHKYIRENMEKHGGKINSTAGDGVMSFFNSAKDAINAAIDIRNGLLEFNRTRNRLPRPFRLRLGIHTGSAVIDEEGKMDQMYTEVPDVAGHIQKRAGENEIIISETSYNEIANKADFVALKQKIDRFSVFRFNG